MVYVYPGWAVSGVFLPLGWWMLRSGISSILYEVDGWWGWMEILHNKYVIWSDLTVFRGIQMYICTPPDPQLTCLNFCQFMQSARSAEAENFHLNLNRQASVWYFSLSFSCVQPSATEGMPLSWTVHLYACLYNSSQLIPLCYRRLLWCCWCWDCTLSSLILI